MTNEEKGNVKHEILLTVVHSYEPHEEQPEEVYAVPLTSDELDEVLRVLYEAYEFGKPDDTLEGVYKKMAELRNAYRQEINS